MRSLLGRFHRPNARSQSEQLFMLNNLGDGSTLSLDFTTGVLDPLLTFTRSTTGTYINSSGYVTSAAINAARFDYDPTTLTARGLLIEGSASNLLTYSEDQGNNTTWSAFGTSVTRTTGQTDPGNNSTATKLVFNATATDAVISRSVTVLNATQYTISMWMRADSGTVTNVRFARAAGSAGAIFPTLTTAWQRVSLTFTSSTTSDGIEIRVLNAGSPKTATVHLWGAQLEAGSGASSYIPTVASTGTRAADFCTIPTASFIPGNPYPQTLFVDCIPANPSAAFLDIVRLFDRTASGVFSYGTEIYYYGSSTMTAQRKTIASTSSDRPLASGLAYNSRHKLAVSVDSSAFLGSYDGLTGTGTTTAPPALATQVTHMGVGCTGDTTPGSVMFGTIRQIKFFPFAMAQSQLNAVTTL